jgi:hypothetical protein
MELFAAILIIAGIIILIVQGIEPAKHQNISQKGIQWDPEVMVECWGCPSCSQWNRTQYPFYWNNQQSCQNCYEPRPASVEYQTISLDVYWSQARFAQEHFRREAEKAKQKPWIDPSIAPPGTGRHTIDFNAPRKEMPDDLKDKISRN